MTAWLIEAHGPRWLGYRDGTLDFEWVTDANDARHFDTEAEARSALESLAALRPAIFAVLDGSGATVTEHQWGSP